MISVTPRPRPYSGRLEADSPAISPLIVRHQSRLFASSWSGNEAPSHWPLPLCVAWSTSPSPRGRKTNDVVLATRSRPSFATLFQQRPPKKAEGSGAPKGALFRDRASGRGRPPRYPPPLAGSNEGGSPLGAPPRRLPRKSMPWLSPGRASRDGRGRRRYLRHGSRLSDAPRAPVVMPAGSMPGPPGSGVTSPARGNRTRPISRLSPVTPRRARFAECNLNGDHCQEMVVN